MPTVTTTLSAAQWARLSAAVGKKYGYRDAQGAARDATAAEAKADVDAYLRSLVHAAEQLPPPPPAAFDPT